MKQFLGSPLLHFVFLGALAFVFYGRLRGGSVNDSRRIEISEQQIVRLSEMWTAQWKRPPTEVELQGLVDNFVREEILYREALAMGLDRDDTVVRRRLAQKLEFLADDLATRAQPTREEIERFYEENSKRYQLPARVSFSHLYFSLDRRGASAQSDALDALERIRAGSSPDGFGDPLMLERDYPSRSEDEVAGLFGSEFASALLRMEAGGWMGPVPSSYGLHLVLVRERTPARTPELTEVSDRVQSDLLTQRRDDAKQALIDSLKQRYQIVIAGQ